ncbi:MAG TPA: hypothetical protein VN257_08305 [Actinotalea sp.]|nr:hypothetical protein [Actinotalea sp.]
MIPVPPDGGPRPPLRTATTVLVPVVLVSTSVAYSGWDGWVPMIGALAVLGTLAVVSPRGRVWRAVAAGVGELTGASTAWLERTGPWWGTGMILVAGTLAMGRLTPV